MLRMQFKVCSGVGKERGIRFGAVAVYCVSSFVLMPIDAAVIFVEK